MTLGRRHPQSGDGANMGSHMELDLARDEEEAILVAKKRQRQRNEARREAKEIAKHQAITLPKLRFME